MSTGICNSAPRSHMEHIERLRTAPIWRIHSAPAARGLLLQAASCLCAGALRGLRCARKGASSVARAFARVLAAAVLSRPGQGNCYTATAMSRYCYVL